MKPLLWKPYQWPVSFLKKLLHVALQPLPAETAAHQSPVTPHSPAEFAVRARGDDGEQTSPIAGNLVRTQIVCNEMQREYPGGRFWVVVARRGKATGEAYALENN